MYGYGEILSKADITPPNKENVNLKKLPLKSALVGAGLFGGYMGLKNLFNKKKKKKTKKEILQDIARGGLAGLVVGSAVGAGLKNRLANKNKEGYQRAQYDNFTRKDYLVNEFQDIASERRYGGSFITNRLNKINQAYKNDKLKNDAFYVHGKIPMKTLFSKKAYDVNTVQSKSRLLGAGAGAILGGAGLGLLENYSQKKQILKKKRKKYNREGLYSSILSGALLGGLGGYAGGHFVGKSLKNKGIEISSAYKADMEDKIRSDYKDSYMTHAFNMKNENAINPDVWKKYNSHVYMDRFRANKNMFKLLTKPVDINLKSLILKKRK